MEALTLALENNGALIAKGVYQSPPLEVATHKGAAAGLSPTYSFSAYVADVEVDPETGYVQVHKIWAAHDCGRALNPIAVEGQIEGSIHMGLGQALMEELRFNKGQTLEPNLLDYRTLSARQMPEVEVIVVETNDPEGPFGAKEVGEGPLAPVIPAVANAIYDAVGVRLRELPMTPDRVLEAIDQKREREQKLAHAAE
jgi:CO/xanthine dehydrogenase Mo-binding subunit